MSNTEPPCNVLWTPEQTARFLGLANLRSLNAWRLRRQGPAYIKVGRLVRYRPANVHEWLTKQTVGAA